MLSIEALDKIHNELDLLCDYNYIERKNTLRETYENVIGIYNLERTSLKMWEMVWNHEITSLFQMEQQSGISGIGLIHPKNVSELAVLNSVIRLMAPEKGAEQPLDTWARYRNNINDWYREMESYGLNEDDINWLSNHSAITNGICESQEGLMSLLQEERLGGNSLSFADKCRKAIAKKVGKLFDECENEYFENAKKKNCDMKLVHYVWDVLFRVQRGYSFCRAHTLSYSLVALQEMNLAYRFPIIFWNCACLISDSGGQENLIEEEENENNEVEDIYVDYVEEFKENENEENDEDEDENEIEESIKKKKKKTKAINYGKISSAIGKMRMSGIDIAPPDINKSTYTFSPDVEKSLIRYGMSGIVKVGEDVVKSIIENRPYTSLKDFLSKVKVNKPQMINLIKAGAFDEFGKREQLMFQYVSEISDTKKRITLQNMKMLIDFELIPDEYDLQRRVYNFNKYLKKMKLDATYYGLDNIALNFFDKHFDVDNLYPTDKTESGLMIKQTVWDKIYQKHMDIIRPYVKSHNEELLQSVNNTLISQTWDKYCKGNISKWEMDAVSCYFHQHELEYVDELSYECNNFYSLPEEPEIDTIITIKGKQVPLFKIRRIMGTVLDKNKTKKTVTLLTTDGVVTVKIFGDVFNHYDRQISEKDSTGKKHVIEKSIFSRGNKIIVTGIRREDSFLLKTYARTPWRAIELIENINEDGTLILKSKRE